MELSKEIMKSFYEWLKEKSEEDTPVGDFAQDTMRLNRASEIPNNLKSWQDFVSLNGGSRILDVLKEAWDEYSKSI